MGILRIHLFGIFRLYRDSLHQEIRVIPNVQSLLGLLLSQSGRMFSRDKLANLLWGECAEEQAHSCLNTALWRLRKVLESQGVPAGTCLRSTANGELGFNCMDDCWVDVIEFEKTIQDATTVGYRSASTDEIFAIEQAVGLYNEDFLEGCYHDWVLRERERLHLIYMDALYYLLSFNQYHREYEKAIRWGQQILLVDPLREDVHRDLMRLYTENGQRALAVRQYQHCRKILEAELSIGPMPETQLVYDEILGKQRARVSRIEDYAQIGETVESLQNAMEYIYRAQQDLQDALARLNK